MDKAIKVNMVKVPTLTLQSKGLIRVVPHSDGTTRPKGLTLIESARKEKKIPLSTVLS